MNEILFAVAGVRAALDVPQSLCMRSCGCSSVPTDIRLQQHWRDQSVIMLPPPTLPLLLTIILELSIHPTFPSTGLSCVL